MPDAPTLLKAAITYLEEADSRRWTVIIASRLASRPTCSSTLRRELELRDAQATAERARLAKILGHNGDVETLSHELSESHPHRRNRNRRSRAASPCSPVASRRASDQQPKMAHPLANSSCRTPSLKYDCALHPTRRKAPPWIASSLISTRGSRPNSSPETVYVSISRARSTLAIYTMIAPRWCSTLTQLSALSAAEIRYRII